MSFLCNACGHTDDEFYVASVSEIEHYEAGGAYEYGGDFESDLESAGEIHCPQCNSTDVIEVESVVESPDDFEMHCLQCDCVSPGEDACPVCGSDDLEFHRV